MSQSKEQLEPWSVSVKRAQRKGVGACRGNTKEWKGYCAWSLFVGLREKPPRFESMLDMTADYVGRREGASSASGAFYGGRSEVVLEARRWHGTWIKIRHLSRLFLLLGVPCFVFGAQLAGRRTSETHASRLHFVGNMSRAAQYPRSHALTSIHVLCIFAIRFLKRLCRGWDGAGPRWALGESFLLCRSKTRRWRVPQGYRRVPQGCRVPIMKIATQLRSRNFQPVVLATTCSLTPR